MLYISVGIRSYMLGDIQFRNNTLSWSGKRRNAGTVVQRCKVEETNLVSRKHVNLKPLHVTIHFIFFGQLGLSLLNVAGTVTPRDDHHFLNWCPNYSKLLDCTAIKFFLRVCVVLCFVHNAAFTYLLN